MLPHSTAATPEAYIDTVDAGRRADVQRLHTMVREIAPDLEPTMEFGFLGYGPFRYGNSRGLDGAWIKIGIAARKRSISIYVGCDDRISVTDAFRDRLPGAEFGAQTVRIRRLADVDEPTLRRLILVAAEVEPRFDVDPLERENLPSR